MTGNDRSRNGYLVHDAHAGGRWVTVLVYIEGTGESCSPVEARITCRTSEQASEMARVLRDARSAEAWTGRGVQDERARLVEEVVRTALAERRAKRGRGTIGEVLATEAAVDALADHDAQHPGET